MNRIDGVGKDTLNGYKKNSSLEMTSSIQGYHQMDGLLLLQTFFATKCC